MISSKIKRNDPCWCGSQKKYKKCHLNRDIQTPAKPWEVSKEFNKTFSKQVCSCPETFRDECTTKIVKAHTVPKSSSLKAIAENGHVLGLKMSLDTIRKNRGKPQVEKLGINNASTFNGFCTKHDDGFFAPIEKMPFENSEKQCFLLSYRSFSREYYAKSSALETTDLLRQTDKGRSQEAQMEIQMKSFLMQLGAMTSMNDLERHKEYFDHSLETSNFSNSRAVVFTFDTPPPIMVSGSVNPDYDFNGALIQDLTDLKERTDIVSVTSFYDGKAGKIVFSWLDHCHETCSKLVSTLFQKEESMLTTFIVQYIVKSFENFFISPTWWELVDSESKSNILRLVADSISLDIDYSSNGLNNKLIDISFPEIKNIEFVNWSLSREP